MSRAWSAVLTAGVLALSACDSGPSGPGALGVVAEGASLGGVVLEVEGTGIRSFTARGSSRVYSAAVPGRTATHRVIVITPDPGSTAFDMEVDDIGMEGPIVRVVSAADGSNRMMAASAVTIRVER